MKWYELYQNNRSSGRIDFDYIAPIICNQKQLIGSLDFLVSEYLTTPSSCFRRWTRRLIFEILEYFRVHMWDDVVLVNFHEARDFLNKCANMEEIPDTEDFIGNIEIKNLAYELILGIADDTVSKSRVFKHFHSTSDSMRAYVIGYKDMFLELCNQTETLENKVVREQAKYILINFIPDMIPKEAISGITELVLTGKITN